MLVLKQKKGMVRSVDLARHMGFSKPSISHAVGVLRDGGFLTMDADGFLYLTDIGREVAEKIYEAALTRHIRKQADEKAIVWPHLPGIVYGCGVS